MILLLPIFESFALSVSLLPVVFGDMLRMVAKVCLFSLGGLIDFTRCLESFAIPVCKLVRDKFLMISRCGTHEM